MPSQFEEAMADNLATLYDSFGVAGVYTGPDAVPVLVTVRRHPEPWRAEVADTRLSQELGTGELLMRASDFAASGPVKGGRIVLEAGAQGGGGVWSIEATPLLKNGQYHCSCRRTASERVMPRMV